MLGAAAGRQEVGDGADRLRVLLLSVKLAAEKPTASTQAARATSDSASRAPAPHELPLHWKVSEVEAPCSEASSEAAGQLSVNR